MSIGQELLNVPMGDMIRQMAFAIAEGQMRLDANSIDVAEMMGGLKIIYDDEGKPTFDDSRIFFGYDLMTIAQAEAYMAADVGLSGGDATAMIKKLRELDSVPVNADKNKQLIRVPTRVSMLELGFSPTFYQFVDTIIEVKIAIKITRSFESTRTVKTGSQTNSKVSSGGGLFGALFGAKKNDETTVSTSQVDATYSSKYSYSAEGSSLLRTKLVPLPPPPILEERIRRQLDEDVARRKRLLDQQLATAPAPSPAPTPP
jgi:hypothetical protein